jgi:pilus assembly protein CpaF
MSGGTANGASAAPAPTDGQTAEQRAFKAAIDFFLRPLVPLMRDESVSEIMVNGPDAVYIERAGKIERTPAKFTGERAVISAAKNIAQFVGRAVSEAEPILDGRLPDGSRICIVLSPIAGGGTSINIRKFARKAVNAGFLTDKKAMTPESLEFLLMNVEAGMNIIVSGGTGSGKTTLLNILSTKFDDHERIVVIEDTRELQIQKEHVVQMEARPADAYGRGAITVRDLFVAALRMRPDRIVVGEVRRGEALDMLQAMSSGHRGSMATLHADTPGQACGRLETMCMMADSGLPLAALRRQVASAVDVVVQAARLHSGRRLITHISEIYLNEEINQYVVKDIYTLDKNSDFPELRWTGQVPKLAGQLVWMGLDKKVDLTKHLYAGSLKA